MCQWLGSDNLSGLEIKLCSVYFHTHHEKTGGINAFVSILSASLKQSLMEIFPLNMSK